MEFYLKNNFNLSQEDREIQNSFWKLFGMIILSIKPTL